jgi:hypothetical protein
MLTNDEKSRITEIVRKYLTDFAENSLAKHVKDVNNPKGVINSKKHNVFMRSLPNEIIYYSALVRSFDSSFGRIFENIALEIASGNYQVSQKVVGKIDSRQLDHINDMMVNYKRGTFSPDTSHYRDYSTTPFSLRDAQHTSDHLFYDIEDEVYHIIELKAGGDLDNKKAEVEKRALLEQYFILKNGTPLEVRLHFATAYNKFGEGNEWRQENVRTFFAPEELLIGMDFWNFVCKDGGGFEAVIAAYNENVHIITLALDRIKEAYAI